MLLKCDVCGKVSEKVKIGRWIFYCDNPECKAKEEKLLAEELEYALQQGVMPDYDVLEDVI